jgi:hypothetical protein
VNRLILLSASLVVAATPLGAQNTIAQAVSRAPDGIVRVQFASRQGVCGDGGDVVGYRKAIFAASVESIGGDWSGMRCVAGPVRVAMIVVNGKPTQLQTFVSGSWSRSGMRVTDLGTVSANDAAAYFFSIIPQLEGRKNKSRNLLPAVLAAADGTVPRLINLARDGSRAGDTRRDAIKWIGLLGDGSVVPMLVSFAKEGGALRGGSDDIDDDDEGTGKGGLATAAIAALSFLERGVGVPSLIDLARNGASGVRSSAVFWLGQSGDPRAIAVLRSIIENTREDERVRSRAIFSLAHGNSIPESEYAYLRGLYQRLGSEKMKEMILMGAAEDGPNGSSWLIAQARNRSEPMKMRKSALFWAGQRDETPTKDLVAFYRAASDAELREHAIFVLSQRDDRASSDELLRIAQSDPDRQMRSRALFWLGQKDDPRVAKLISDRLSK